jgi:hypothetical protein
VRPAAGLGGKRFGPPNSINLFGLCAPFLVLSSLRLHVVVILAVMDRFPCLVMFSSSPVLGPPRIVLIISQYAHLITIDKLPGFP